MINVTTGEEGGCFFINPSIGAPDGGSSRAPECRILRNYYILCTEKMSPVYICQNDKPMTSLALSTAHQVKTNLCQPHSLKGCHIFVINLPKTCHPQFLFHAVDGSRVPI